MKKNNKEYHELKEEEFNYLLDLYPGITCKQVAELFKQPEWCGYPEAISALGCSSLMSFMVSEDYCKGCECYK